MRRGIAVLDDTREIAIDLHHPDGEWMSIRAPARWAQRVAEGAESGAREKNVDKLLREVEHADRWSTRICVNAFYGAPRRLMSLKDSGHAANRASPREPGSASPASRGESALRVSLLPDDLAEVQCGEDGHGACVQAPRHWAWMTADCMDQEMEPRDIEIHLCEAFGIDRSCARLLVTAFGDIPPHVFLPEDSSSRSESDRESIRDESPRPGARQPTDETRSRPTQAEQEPTSKGKETERNTSDLSFLEWPIAKAVVEMAKLRVSRDQLVQYILNRSREVSDRTKSPDKFEENMHYAFSYLRIEETEPAQRPLNQQEAELLADHALQQVPAAPLLLSAGEATQKFDWDKYDMEDIGISKRARIELMEVARQGDLKQVLNLVQRKLIECDPDQQDWVAQHFFLTYQPQRPAEPEPQPYDWDKYDRKAMGLSKTTHVELVEAAEKKDMDLVKHIIGEELGDTSPEQRSWLAERYERRYVLGERPPR